MNTNQRKNRTSAGRLSNEKIRQTSGNAEHLDRRELRARPYPSLLPEGEYLAFATRFFWDIESRTYGDKIYIYFTILDGEYSGKEVRMFLRAESKPLLASKSPKLSREKCEQRATQLSLFDDKVAS